MTPPVTGASPGARAPGDALGVEGESASPLPGAQSQCETQQTEDEQGYRDVELQRHYLQPCAVDLVAHLLDRGGGLTERERKHRL